ncbi:Sas10/Utp3/C1D family-domain-containing protein, partial [Aspergillus aurantiobrunneus]
MEPADLIPLLEQLDDKVDDLEEVLTPILQSTVIENSKKLPVLDKAKFHVLITYALESLIFSYLRLHGVKATEHPVFRELTRVKQYFAKIKSLETEPEPRTMLLDKQAAGRFIKRGLSGNDKLDLQREEQLAKEKARAQLKASLLAKKSSVTPVGSSKHASSDSESDANPNSDPASDAQEGGISQTVELPETSAASTQNSKKNKAKSGAKGTRHKKHRSKEERRERRNERRKKKDEARKTRKET